MKHFIKFVLFCCFLVGFVFCHIKREDKGLFYKFVTDALKRQKVSFEVRADNTDSLVFNINGIGQFTRLVINNSFYKPVVLKIYAPTNSDSANVKSVFQSLADTFKNKVIFAGLDASQNADLLVKITVFCKLKRVELPLFLFFQDGQIKMPLLVGYQPQEYLTEFIRKVFFDKVSNFALNRVAE